MGQTFHVEAMLGANASQFDAVMQHSKGKLEELGTAAAKKAGSGFAGLSKDIIGARSEMDAVMKAGTSFISMFKGAGAALIGAQAISSMASYREETRKANEELRIQFTRRGQLAGLAGMSGRVKEIAGMDIARKAELDSFVNNAGFLDMVTGAAAAKAKALSRVAQSEKSGAIIEKNVEAGVQTAALEATIRYGELEGAILIRNFQLTREINDARKLGLTFLADQLERQKSAHAVFDMQARAIKLVSYTATKDETAAVKSRLPGGSQEQMDLDILKAKLKAQQALAMVQLEEKDRAAARLEIERTKLSIQEKQIAIAERLAGLEERNKNARSRSEGFTKQWEESQNRLDRINKMLENPNLSAEKRQELETQRNEEEKNRHEIYRNQTREQMGVFQEAGGAYIQNRLMRAGASGYQRANAEEDWNMKGLRERMQFETDPTAKARIGAQLMGAQQNALERLQGVAPLGDSLARSGGGGNIAAAPDTGKRAIEIQQSMDATLKLILQSLNGGLPGGGNSYVLPPAVN